MDGESGTGVGGPAKEKWKFQMIFLWFFLFNIIDMGLTKHGKKVSKKKSPLLSIFEAQSGYFLSSTWNSILTRDSKKSRKTSVDGKT